MEELFGKDLLNCHLRRVEGGVTTRKCKKLFDESEKVGTTAFEMIDSKYSRYELISQGKIIDKYTIDDKRSYTILYKRKLFVCEIFHGNSYPKRLICWKLN